MKDLARDLLNKATFTTETSKFQRQVFNYWTSHNSDPVYQAMAFDTETTGIDYAIPHPLHFCNTDFIFSTSIPFGISLAIPTYHNINLFWGRIGTDLYDDCAKILREKGQKVAHNLKYDIRVLRDTGISVSKVSECTLTMARIHWNRRMDFGLKDLAIMVMKDPPNWEVEVKATLRNIRSSYTRAGYPKEYCNYSFVPDKIIDKYSMYDAFFTFLLNVNLRPYIIEDHAEAYRRERKFIPIASKMEARGMVFSRHTAKKEIKTMRPKIKPTLNKMHKIVGKEFNPRSYLQLREAFYSLGVTESQLTRKGKITTDKDKLKELKTKKHTSKKVKKLIDTLFDLRAFHKLLGTYIEPLKDRAKLNHGVVFCNINPTDTRTSRMTITNPALQTIPRPTSFEGKKNPVRKCFICRPGRLNGYIDYSQMEMWLFAILAKERIMLKALMNGLDIHQFVADEIYGKGADSIKRQRCKAVNFGIIFGIGVKTLAENNEMSIVDAHDLKNEYFERYPKVQKFLNSNKHLLATQGYVEDLFGRRYNIEVDKAYKAVNALVQGSCAQIIKAALIKINKYIVYRNLYLEHNINLLLPIHDEIIFEFHKSLKKWHELFWDIQNMMENIRQLKRIGITLPTEASVTGGSWEDKHSLWRSAYVA